MLAGNDISDRFLCPEQDAKLTGEVTSCTRCLSILIVSHSIWQASRNHLLTDVQQYSSVGSLIHDVVLKDFIVKGTRRRIGGRHAH